MMKWIVQLFRRHRQSHLSMLQHIMIHNLENSPTGKPEEAFFVPLTSAEVRKLEAAKLVVHKKMAIPGAGKPIR